MQLKLTRKRGTSSGGNRRQCGTEGRIGEQTAQTKAKEEKGQTSPSKKGKEENGADRETSALDTARAFEITQGVWRERPPALRLLAASKLHWYPAARRFLFLCATNGRLSSCVSVHSTPPAGASAARRRVVNDAGTNGISLAETSEKQSHCIQEQTNLTRP
jgi:hypothetical protein